MRLVVGLAFLVALVAVPAISFGSGSTSQNAVKLCRDANKTHRDAFGKCVSGRAKRQRTNESHPESHPAPRNPESKHDALQNASRICKSGRHSMGLQAFDRSYGTNPNRRNAFGKCVSQHVRSK